MIAFKEWKLICDALGSGRQSLILRKGGIAEGRAGFAFQHEEFALFPTLFHEQVAKLKMPVETALPTAQADGIIQLEWFVRVEWTATLTDPEVVQHLALHHLWRDEVIAERFAYGEHHELHVAFIRAYAFQPAWSFPDAPRYGGCRSWVSVPDPPAWPAEPVLEAVENARRSAEIRRICRLD